MYTNSLIMKVFYDTKDNQLVYSHSPSHHIQTHNVKLVTYSNFYYNILFDK